MYSFILALFPDFVAERIGPSRTAGGQEGRKDDRAVWIRLSSP